MSDANFTNGVPATPALYKPPRLSSIKRRRGELTTPAVTGSAAEMCNNILITPGVFSTGSMTESIRDCPEIADV